MKLIHGDCLEVMQDIPDKSIDMILADLPYGTTACKWDVIIPFEPLWEQYKRIVKDRAAVVLFGSEPFASHLRLSNLKWYKYDWIWVKNKSGGFIHAKNMPMKYHELLLVFSKNSMGHKSTLKEKRMNYFPQGLKKNKRKVKAVFSDNKVIGSRPSQKKDGVISKFSNYPKSVLYFDKGNLLHSTQKPVELCKYLIRTYTSEGDIVLDNVMGSGTTGVACVRAGREFIGIEKELEYFEIAQKRIAGAQPPLFT